LWSKYTGGTDTTIIIVGGVIGTMTIGGGIIAATITGTTGGGTTGIITATGDDLRRAEAGADLAPTRLSLLLTHSSRPARAGSSS
jgi:hypothetical protein